MGFVCFFSNEAWVGGPLMKIRMKAGCWQSRALYVRIQQLDKQAKLSGAAEVESGQREEGGRFIERA